MKKYLLGVLITSTLFISSVFINPSPVQADGLSLSNLIQILIQVGAIAPDKVEAANLLLSILDTDSNTHSTTTIKAKHAGGGGGGSGGHAHPVYSIIYNGNNNDDGGVPVESRTYMTDSSVTVKDNYNGLTQSGYNFWKWNTVPNGSGTDYLPGSTLTMGTSDVELYAQWFPITNLSISIDPSSPAESYVQVSDTDATEMIVLRASLHATGGNLNVDSLNITLNASTSAATLSDIIESVSVATSSTILASSTAINGTSNQNLTLNLNTPITIAAGDTQIVYVAVNVKPMTDFVNNDSINISIDGAEASDTENFASVVNGSAQGADQILYDRMILVGVNSTSGVITSNDGPANDSVTYTVSLTVEALGDDFYLSNSTTTAFSYLHTGTTPTTNQALLSALDSVVQDDNSTFTYFYVADGDSRDFTYTVILTASTTASTVSNFKISDLGYGVDPNIISSFGEIEDSAVNGSKLLD